MISTTVVRRQEAEERAEKRPGEREKKSVLKAL